MNRVRINGIDMVGGRSITVANGRITIDGKDVTPEAKQITIQVVGDIHNLEVDSCERITASGSVGALRTTSGDVECGPVTGGVHTVSGDVTCEGSILGSVQTTSGDIRAGGGISGNARSVSGNIRGV